MSRRCFFIIIFFLMASIRLLIIPLQTSDLAIWIAQGVKTIGLGCFLNYDVFSIHEGLEFVYPARLSNIILGYLYNVFGLNGVYIFLRLNFVVVFVYVFFKFAKNKINFNIYNFSLLVISMLGITFPMDRPQSLITIIAFVVFNLIIKTSLKTREFVIFFTGCILWNNLHSSVFILFPVVLWKLIVSMKMKASLRSSSLILFLFVVSTFITNSGFHIYEYVYQTIIISNARGITEWGNIFHWDYPAQTCLYLFSMFMIIYIAYKQRKCRALFLNPLCPLLFVGIMSIRNTYWLFLTIIPLISYLDLWSKQSDLYFMSPKRNILVVLCTCWLIIAFSPLVSNGNHNNWGYSKDTPMKIIKHINTKKIDLRIYNQWELGSALALLQKNKIFIDSRNIIYKNNIFIDYQNIMNGKSSLELLSKYNMDAVIIKNESFPIVNVLKEEASWMMILADDNFLFFIKKSN